MPRNYRTTGDPSAKSRRLAALKFDNQAKFLRAAAKKGGVKRTAVTKTWKSKVDKLLSGHRKDAPDILRHNAYLVPGTTVSYCLTSSDTTQNGTGASSNCRAQQTTGLLSGDADQATINSVRISGNFDVRCLHAANTNGFNDAKARTIVVWFDKAATLATAGAGCPIIDEIMSTTFFQEFQPTYGQNKAYSNSYKILWDHVWDLGMCALDTTSFSSIVTEPTYAKFDKTIVINKNVKFIKPATDTLPGGHYDSDVPEGQISKGLLMMYTWQVGGTQTTVNYALTTRLTYTM